MAGKEMKTIKKWEDIPDKFFHPQVVSSGFSALPDRRKEKIYCSPKSINKQTIYCLREDGDQYKKVDYQPCKVELDTIYDGPGDDTGSIEPDPVEAKREKILNHIEKSSIYPYYLDKEYVIGKFERIKNESNSDFEEFKTYTYTKNNKIVKIISFKTNNFEFTLRNESFEEIKEFNSDIDDDGKRRFELWLETLLDRNNKKAILDLEIGQSRSDSLAAFNARVAAFINDYSDVFDEKKLKEEQLRLSEKESGDILKKIMEVEPLPVVISADFEMYHDNDEGFYFLYFKHEDSDKIKKDLYISVGIEKSLMNPGLIAAYKTNSIILDKVSRQDKEKTPNKVRLIVVGSIARREVEWGQSKEYFIPITPIAIYSC